MHVSKTHIDTSLTTKGTAQFLTHTKIHNISRAHVRSILIDTAQPGCPPESSHRMLGKPTYCPLRQQILRTGGSRRAPAHFHADLNHLLHTHPHTCLAYEVQHRQAARIRRSWLYSPRCPSRSRRSWPGQRWRKRRRAAPHIGRSRVQGEFPGARGPSEWASETGYWLLEILVWCTGGFKITARSIGHVHCCKGNEIKWKE